MLDRSTADAQSPARFSIVPPAPTPSRAIATHPWVLFLVIAVILANSLLTVLSSYADQTGFGSVATHGATVGGLLDDGPRDGVPRDDGPRGH